MNRKPPRWEEPEPSVKVLKLYETDLNPDWPRIVVLDLTIESFNEFEKDVLAFDKKHGLFPDQPMLWISHGAKPPVGRGLPIESNPTRCRVVVLHHSGSRATYAACPYAPA